MRERSTDKAAEGGSKKEKGLMKKYITLTALVVAGSTWSCAATEDLTLTSPAGGGLSNGNAYIAWSGSDSWLTSWEISFSLWDAELSESALFSTTKQGGGGATGYVLSTTSDGRLSLISTVNSSFDLTTTESVITAGTRLDGITLSFVADRNADTDAIESGTFTLSVGGEVLSESVSVRVSNEDPSFLATNDRTLLFNGENTIDGTTWSSRFWTNGGAEILSGIELRKLDDNIVIPEPSSFAGLTVLGALVFTVSRRRRERITARRKPV